MIIRRARPGDADAIYSLIEKNRERGHLLPRTAAEITARISSTASFYVADAGAEPQSRLVACAEVARLSRAVAEIRSLVVDEPFRGQGVASKLVSTLHRRAFLDGHDRLCAFSHDPAPFIRLGFSIVPHAWIPEKISADCAGCALFRQCGQHALVLFIARRSSQWQSWWDAA